MRRRGPPECHPRSEPPDVRLLRTRDLIDLRLEAPGCTIEPTDGGAELVAGPDALARRPLPAAAPRRGGLAGRRPAAARRRCRHAGRRGHVAAGPTGWSTRCPEGTRIAYTLDGVLAALPALKLRVAPGATPAGEATPTSGGPEPPSGPRDRDRGALPADRLAERARRVPPRAQRRSGPTTGPSCGGPTSRCGPTTGRSTTTTPTSASCAPCGPATASCPPPCASTSR